jgi:hypothetical protein
MAHGRIHSREFKRDVVRQVASEEKCPAQRHKWRELSSAEVAPLVPAMLLLPGKVAWRWEATFRMASKLAIHRKMTRA